MRSVRQAGFGGVAAPRATDPDLCLKCGACCSVKLRLDGEVVTTPFMCPHLAEVTRLCTIFERRFELNPFCITVEQGIELGIYAGTCPYVRDVPDYVTPRPATPEEIETYAEVCLDAVEEIRMAYALAIGDDKPDGSLTPS